MKQFWNKILAGLVIGAGAILPGLSGGILAVSMGLYQPAIEAVTGFFKNPKKNLKFLLPLAIGGVIGFLIFMLIINRFFSDYETEIICLFVGLVIGSVSSFLKEAKGDEKPFKKRNWLFAVGGFAVALALLLLSMQTGDGAVTSRAVTPLIAAACGGIVMLGVTLPGISTSFILINMGVYDNFMQVFVDLLKLKGLDISSFSAIFTNSGYFWHNILLGLSTLAGIVIVAVPTLLIVKKLLEKFHCQSYFTLFGILIAMLVGCVIQQTRSIISVGGLAFHRYIIFAVLIAVGAACSYIMDRGMKKLEVNEKKEEALQ